MKALLVCIGFVVAFGAGYQVGAGKVWIGKESVTVKM
jgi:hypothetical protein